jgi:outer membrane protein OmpA-like peptidoglycan-associated protein
LATNGGSGTGAVTFAAENGTATGCVVSAGSLTSKSAGTCIVTASKAADTTYLAVSSSATTIAFKLPGRPATITLPFGAKGSALSGGAKKALQSLARKLLAGASVTITGYAKGNERLARSRASAAANYLSIWVTIHIKVKTASRPVVNKVTVATTKQ